MEPKSRVVIKSEAERLVYGEVYAPLQVDTDEEAMTAEEIKKMAHGFLMDGFTSKIDVNHQQQESGCLIVESFLARKNDPDNFVEGSWVLGVKVLPDELWEAIQKGELNGFSFGGSAPAKETITVLVSMTRRMVGSCEKSEDGGLLPPHDHSIDIEFDKDGTVTKGETSFDLGHKHSIQRTTATEKAMEHSHRLILISAEE